MVLPVLTLVKKKSLSLQIYASKKKKKKTGPPLKTSEPYRKIRLPPNKRYLDSNVKIPQSFISGCQTVRGTLTSRQKQRLMVTVRVVFTSYPDTRMPTSEIMDVV